MKTTFLVLHTVVMCFQRGSTVDDVPQTFQLLPATAWCPSGMYLQPNHPLWHFQNKAITHHLPPSATKTRGHAVQASCWICMCDPFWRIIPSFSVGRTSPHTSVQWLTSPFSCALKWAFPSWCHGQTGSSVEKKYSSQTPHVAMSSRQRP